jgi:hypothetical protein
MLPAPNLSNLPAAARAIVHTSRLEFMSTNRGHVRQSNDSTADSRLRFFALWLESLDFTQQLVSSLDSKHVIDVLGAYVYAVCHGHNLKRTLITGQTLRNYTKSAADCLTLLTGRPCTYYDSATLSMKRVALHPYLHEQISQRAAWTKPQPRKEPFTYLMLATHAKTVLKPAPDPFSSFLSLLYAVYDWL